MKADKYEFYFYVNELERDLNAIKEGSQVYNGMMHKNKVVEIFSNILDRLKATRELFAFDNMEYEANKHYIELGKAVEKAFKADLFSSLAISGDSVQNETDLLEWAEGRE